jgi:hypothetical protein
METVSQDYGQSKSTELGYEWSTRVHAHEIKTMLELNRWGRGECKRALPTCTYPSLG